MHGGTTQAGKGIPGSPDHVTDQVPSVHELRTETGSAILLGFAEVKTRSGKLHYRIVSWPTSWSEAEIAIMYLLGKKNAMWHFANVRICAVICSFFVRAFVFLCISQFPLLKLSVFLFTVRPWQTGATYSPDLLDSPFGGHRTQQVFPGPQSCQPEMQ